MTRRTLKVRVEEQYEQNLRILAGAYESLKTIAEQRLGDIAFGRQGEFGRVDKLMSAVGRAVEQEELVSVLGRLLEPEDR